MNAIASALRVRAMSAPYGTGVNAATSPGSSQNEISSDMPT